MVFRIGLLVPVLVIAAAAAAAGEEPIVTTDLLRIRSVGSIDVARDGSVAVFSVRSVGSEPAAPGAGGEAEDGDTRYENREHLFAIDLLDVRAVPRQLTFGSRRDAAPSLAPDGRRLAFVRESETKDEDGKRVAQIWIMDLAGGEARQITQLKYGASRPIWSPDGKRILAAGPVPLTELERPDWPSERPGRDREQDRRFGDNDQAAPSPRPDGNREEIRAWLDRNAANHDPYVINRLAFQEEQSLRRNERFVQLLLIDVDAPGAPPVRITNDAVDHLEARFLGTGGRIVYVTQKPTAVHPDRTLERSLWSIDSDGSNDRLLLRVEGFALDAPRPSQDGSMLAFTAKQIDEPAYRHPQLGVIDVKGSLQAGEERRPIWLTDPKSFDGPVRELAWLPARSALIFGTARRGAFPLMTISPGLLEPAPLIESTNELPAGVHQFAVGGGTLVYAVTTPANPCALRVWDGRGDREVDDLNPWVANKRLSMPREGWVQRPDGLSVQYWLMEPTDRNPGQRYPLAVEIHGGPAGMWGPGESTMWLEFQLLCSWGYGVAYCNPRGSSGYGYQFQKANFQNWGAGPASDVLAVVDQVVLSEWIDPERLLVTGGSYAGYLTAWIIGNDQRFKAAVAQRGLYDLGTFFGEGNAWRLVEWAMGGFPWEGRIRPILQRESPISYVSRIRTPLLIIHGSQDLRTGVGQSEMLYRSLKELGRPVEYVRYPGAGHNLSRTGDPKQRMDRLDRIIEFFERFIENQRPAPRIDTEAGSPIAGDQSPASLDR